MTTYYNLVTLDCSPTLETYKPSVTGVTTVDPSGGMYDYTHDVTCNLNSVVGGFMFKQESTGTRSTTGESAAWGSIHQLLHSATSTATGDVILSATTGYGEKKSTEDATWLTFWAGVISRCIDENDRSGLSVKIDALKETLADHTATSNDTLGPLIAAMTCPYGTRAIGDALYVPFSTQYYWASLALFLLEVRGRGVPGGLTSGAADEFARIDLKAGDAIGIRVKCTITHEVTGLITIRQCV